MPNDVRRLCQRTLVLAVVISLVWTSNASEKPKYKCETCDGIVNQFYKVGLT